MSVDSVFFCCLSFIFPSCAEELPSLILFRSGSRISGCTLEIVKISRSKLGPKLLARAGHKFQI